MKGKIFYIIGGIIIGVYSIIKLAHILNPDPVNDDLIDYVNNHLLAAEKMKTTAIDSYNNVAGVNYSGDAKMSDSLKAVVLPMYRQFEQTLRTIKPATKEVTNLNNRYINIADTELSGFTLLLSAIEKEDTILVSEASRRIQTADKEMIALDSALDSLAEKHDVEITRKKLK